MAATGGAPISGDVLKFLKVTLCTNIVEGYG
jgi:long-subunit acyl-CoA synthetase (AMP-forming)